MPDLLDEERRKFTELLDAGFMRHIPGTFIRIRQASNHGGHTGSAHGRRMQDGASTISVYRERLKDRLEDARILTDVMGSDHCPVELDLKD